jgi:hypothetical protein
MIEEAISGMDSTVAVASRSAVELAVGGGDFGGLADEGDAVLGELLA